MSSLASLISVIIISHIVDICFTEHPSVTLLFSFLVEKDGVQEENSHHLHQLTSFILLTSRTCHHSHHSHHPPHHITYITHNHINSHHSYYSLHAHLITHITHITHLIISLIHITLLLHVYHSNKNYSLIRLKFYIPLSEEKAQLEIRFYQTQAVHELMHQYSEKVSKMSKQRS